MASYLKSIAVSKKAGKSIQIFFSVLLLLSSFSVTKPQPVQAQVPVCNYNLTYSTGQPVTGLQIKTDSPYSVQASVDIGTGGFGTFDLAVDFSENGTIYHHQFNIPSPGNVISLDETSLYSVSESPDKSYKPKSGDVIAFEIVAAGTTNSTCMATGFVRYSYTDTLPTCSGDLSVAGTVLTETANGCSGLQIKAELVNGFGATKVLSTDTATSNNWSKNTDISSYTSDWQAITLYSCTTSGSCTQIANLKGTTNPAEGCPTFATYNPPTPTSTDNIQVQYIPLSGTSVSDFQVTVNNGGNVATHPLTETLGRWVSTIGTFPADTTIQWGLFRKTDNFQCDAKSLTIPKGTKGLAAGRNPCDSTGCDTAIGKIPTNLGDFATAVLRIALGIAGGIVLILMTVGSIRVMTSSGDPQKAAAGREMITAALAGALFIAFSVMIMQFLGTAIVPIPGLTFNI